MTAPDRLDWEKVFERAITHGVWEFNGEGREAMKARDAIRELIEADREYDKANLARHCFDSTGMDAAEEDSAYDAMCQRFDTARDRRAAALAALSGGEDHG